MYPYAKQVGFQRPGCFACDQGLLVPALAEMGSSFFSSQGTRLIAEEAVQGTLSLHLASLMAGLDPKASRSLSRRTSYFWAPPQTSAAAATRGGSCVQQGFGMLSKKGNVLPIQKLARMASLGQELWVLWVPFLDVGSVTRSPRRPR